MAKLTHFSTNPSILKPNRSSWAVTEIFVLAANGVRGPVTRSYWVVEGRLAAGAYPDPRPGRDRLGPLLDAGFDLFVNLTEDHPGGGEGHLSRYDGRAVERAAAVHRFPIADMNIPTEALMQRILDGIDAGLENDRRVYVHCFGGSMCIAGAGLGAPVLSSGAGSSGAAMRMRKRSSELRRDCASATGKPASAPALKPKRNAG